MRTLIALAAFALALVAEKLTRPVAANPARVSPNPDTIQDELLRCDIHDLYMK